MNINEQTLRMANIVVTSSVNLDTNCTIIIEDSVFVIGYQLLLHDPTSAGSIKDKPIMATLNNVTFANCTGGNGHGVVFEHVAVRLVSCTFEHNVASAIVTEVSNVIFEGNHIFRNNSALFGGGIQLLDSSFMYLQPHTRILLEDNRSEYVGGAIYTNNKACADPCVFQ